MYVCTYAALGSIYFNQIRNKYEYTVSSMKIQMNEKDIWKIVKMSLLFRQKPPENRVLICIKTALTILYNKGLPASLVVRVLCTKTF